MLSTSNLQAGEGNEPEKNKGKKHFSGSFAILRAKKVLITLKTPTRSVLCPVNCLKPPGRTGGEIRLLIIESQTYPKVHALFFNICRTYAVETINQ